MKQNRFPKFQMKFDRTKAFYGISGNFTKNNVQIGLPFYQIRENFLISKEVMRCPTISELSHEFGGDELNNVEIRILLKLISSTTFIPGVSSLSDSLFETISSIMTLSMTIVAFNISISSS